MTEPSLRNSRLVLAGSLAAAIALGSAGFMLGRRSVTIPQPVPIKVAVGQREVPLVPTRDVALDRSALIALAGPAADAKARGEPTPDPARPAVGARFSLAIPFGCAGPLGAEDTTSTGWRYDTVARSLRLQVMRVRWTAEDWVPAEASTQVEALEGFWIPRPWTGSENCPTTTEPATAPGAETITLPGQTLGIAQVFTSDSARNKQRGERPYVAVLRVPPDALRTDRGFRVRLSGRVAALPGGAAVQCRQPGGPEQRPICLVVATFDEVSIENAATGETVARWSDTGSAMKD